MINVEGMIAETAAKIYADHCDREVPHKAEAGEYPQKLWDALQENGLPLAWVSEDNGGFGANYDELFGAIWISAQAVSPVPFAETLIANWLLDSPDSEITPNGKITDAARSFAYLENGSANVAFAGVVDQLVAYDSDSGTVGLYNIADLKAAASYPLSPDGDTQLNFAGINPIAQSSTSLLHTEVEAFILTVRAVQIAAAMEAALNLTLDYVTQREQFGRPLAKFQAIQQQLAVAASESAAATMAATQAASSFARNKDHPDNAWHEAVIAKVQTGHSVEAVTEPLHQVHGAMGYTMEYDLHHYTRRLWAWRDALGNEHHWSKILGNELAATSPGQIWKGVTTGEWVAS